MIFMINWLLLKVLNQKPKVDEASGRILNRGASFQKSFGPNSLRGSIESATFTTHSSLEIIKIY